MHRYSFRYRSPDLRSCPSTDANPCEGLHSIHTREDDASPLYRHTPEGACTGLERRYLLSAKRLLDAVHTRR